MTRVMGKDPPGETTKNPVGGPGRGGRGAKWPRREGLLFSKRAGAGHKHRLSAGPKKMGQREKQQAWPRRFSPADRHRGQTGKTGFWGIPWAHRGGRPRHSGGPFALASLARGGKKQPNMILPRRPAEDRESQFFFSGGGGAEKKRKPPRIQNHGQGTGADVPAGRSQRLESTGPRFSGRGGREGSCPRRKRPNSAPGAWMGGAPGRGAPPGGIYGII